MQSVYEPRDMMEGELLRSMLASEGIDAYLAGQHLLGAVGELPVSGLLRLMVDDADVDRAQTLIAGYNAAQPIPDDEPLNVPGSLLC
ncbi:DUF2007 domain-containing protein [Ectopseudomonas mendocina]|uniref:DUF2007 domain-containing protein n=1 Tax=Ectopseudomonas mendocina TaxID=300 RepID=A0ABZ2RIU6_ECTME